LPSTPVGAAGACGASAPWKPAAVALHVGLAAVVFTQGTKPEPSVLRRAVEEGMPLLGARESTFDVASRLYALGMRGQEAPSHEE
jgi:hypothetical protein